MNCLQERMHDLTGIVNIPMLGSTPCVMQSMMLSYNTVMYIAAYQTTFLLNKRELSRMTNLGSMIHVSQSTEIINMTFLDFMKKNPA